ncbi:hypothetical protein D3C76_1297360 [compost metagenome]
MGLQNSTPQEEKAPKQEAVGSVIDAQGKEIPITRQMIKEACEELEKSVVKPVKK